MFDLHWCRMAPYIFVPVGGNGDCFGWKVWGWESFFYLSIRERPALHCSHPALSGPSFGGGGLFCPLLVPVLFLYFCLPTSSAGAGVGAIVFE